MDYMFWARDGERRAALLVDGKLRRTILLLLLFNFLELYLND